MIELLRKIGCVLELNGMFKSEVEEQLHLKFDTMTPINHIRLFRSIIDYHNSNKNSDFMKSLRQKTHSPVTFDTHGRLQFETSLKMTHSAFHYLRSYKTVIKKMKYKLSILI